MTSCCAGTKLRHRRNHYEPFNQARVGAIVQLAVFEAVNAITGEYEPYLNPPTVAPPGASVEAAVIIAAHKVMTTFFPAALPRSTPLVTRISRPFRMVRQRPTVSRWAWPRPMQ